MAKGLFTQGVMVLLDREVGIADVAKCLEEFEPSNPVEASGHWADAGPCVVLNMDEDGGGEEAGGEILVDVVNHPWPDDMGDPESQPEVFAAWGMGGLGPLAYPGNLQRACEQSWTWEGGKTITDKVKGFVRIRSSYSLSGETDDPIIPSDCEPFDELALVTEIAAALLEIPGAIAYFNPNGEVLRDLETLNESLDFAEENDFPPLDLWSNVRLFRTEHDWAIMDTVGNGQLDLPDVEACFHGESYELAEVEQFVRIVTTFLEEAEEPLEDGDSMEGPADIVWTARLMTHSMIDPPRPVLRLFPADEKEVPAEFLQDEPPQDSE